MEENGDESDPDRNRKADPEIVACLLQPGTDQHYPNYVGTRRLLLDRKAQIQSRKVFVEISSRNHDWDEALKILNLC